MPVHREGRCDLQSSYTDLLLGHLSTLYRHPIFFFKLSFFSHLSYFPALPFLLSPPLPNSRYSPLHVPCSCLIWLWSNLWRVGLPKQGGVSISRVGLNPRSELCSFITYLVTLLISTFCFLVTPFRYLSSNFFVFLGVIFLFLVVSFVFSYTLLWYLFLSLLSSSHKFSSGAIKTFSFLLLL